MVQDLLYVRARNASRVRLLLEHIHEGRLGSFDLRAQQRFLLGVDRHEELRVGKDGRRTVQASDRAVRGAEKSLQLRVALDDARTQGRGFERSRTRAATHP